MSWIFFCSFWFQFEPFFRGLRAESERFRLVGALDVEMEPKFVVGNFEAVIAEELGDFLVFVLRFGKGLVELSSGFSFEDFLGVGMIVINRWISNNCANKFFGKLVIDRQSIVSDWRILFNGGTKSVT